MESRGYELLESKLGYTFSEGGRELLENALTHSSYLNENQKLAQKGRRHNERLEFLGDAVLDLAVRHLLMDRFPDHREGELSMLRARLVSEVDLAGIAEEIGLGEWLFLGRGEENTGGRRKPSILADAFEALLAAIYLDGGYPAAAAVCALLFTPRLVAGEAPRSGLLDVKTRLQEHAQSQRMELRYEFAAAGPDHAKSFEVVLWLDGKEVARAEGRSKKEAEQRAAAIALGKIEPTGS